MIDFSPKMTNDEIIKIIHENNKTAVERDSKYRILNEYRVDIERR